MTNVYNAGTVSVETNSNIVTGTDTFFQTVGNVSEGDLFTLDGKIFFEIYQIDTDSQLRIKGRLDELPYGGEPVNDVQYSIIQSFAKAPIAEVAQNVVLLQQKWHQREEEMTGWFSSENNFYEITNINGQKIPVITPTGINNLVDGTININDFGFPEAREIQAGDLNNFPHGNFYSLAIPLARQPVEFASGRKLVFTNKNELIFYQEIIELDTGESRYRVGTDAENALVWYRFSRDSEAIEINWGDIQGDIPVYATRWPSFREVTGDISDVLPDTATRFPDMGEIGGRASIEQMPEQINVDIESLKLSVEDIDNRFVDFEAQTLSIVQQERISTEAAQALLLQSISENAAYQLELARRIEQGEELTNAVVYRDPSNGLIVNRAYNYADDKFTEASLKIDGVSGEVELASKRIENTEDAITSLSSELSLIPGIITAKATAIVSESISALEPAYAFNFFDSAQGWQAVNGTLTAGVNEITVTHGDIENNTLNYLASENKLIRVSLQRLAGSGWSGTVIIERDDSSVETYANYVEEASILLIDFSAMANYTGTVTRVRLVLGASVTDEFKISSISIGKADATTQDLANITSRVNAAELAINANEAEIAQRVSTSYFNENAITVSNVEQKVNALDTIIALEAKRQELIDNNVIQKAVSAATFLNGQTGTIQDIVQSFEQDIEGVESSISDVQQQVNSLGITEQVAGLASQQIQTYDVQAALLQQAVNDLSAYMQEAETNESVALAVNQLQIDVSPEGALAKDIGSLQAVTLSNGNAITATNKRLSQVETDAEGNASAIEQLNLSVSGLSGNLTGALSRLDSVETTANGTASAFSGVQAKVQDSQKGNDALFTFAQQIEVTADDAKEGADIANYAVNQLSNTVNNPTNGLSATNTIAQRAESKADGAQSSITAIESRLSGAEDDASASLTLATDNKGEIDSIRASILLRTDANGVVSAISLDSQNDVSQIAFQAQQIVTLDDEGNPVVFWDTTNGRYVFIGHIDATTGSFGGALNGATGTFSGSLSGASGTFTGTVQGGALISSSGTGFRSIWQDDGTYLGWIGQGAKNDQNSIFAIKKAKDGNPAKVLVNAQFIEGLSSIRGYNEDDDFDVSVVHKDSVGNDVDLTITADIGNFYTSSSNPSSQSINFAWRIVRNSTVIKTGQMRGRRESRFENGEYLVIEVASATIIARDTSPQVGDNTYKFEFTGDAATLDTYDLAIRTEENRMAA